MTFCRRATRIRQCFSLGLILCAGLFLVPLRPVAAQDNSGEKPTALTSEQLVELVGPIALYPDQMIAVVLPASTYPLEVVQADRLLKDNKNKMSEDAIKKLDFDTSILALMHYPAVLDKMSMDLDWTTNLGDAVANQLEEVMAAIQRFRAEAMAAGNLISNDQVVYVTEASTITIVSASPTVIYVPVYNPHVVVVQQSGPSPAVTFVAGIAIGAWLSHGCNWHSSSIRINVNTHRGYWGRHRHYGHYRGGAWGVHSGRRAAARTGARAGARAGYRTGRRHGTRQGYRAGYRAGQRNNTPRARTTNRANRTTNRANSAARTNRANRAGGNRTANRSTNRNAGRANSTSRARSTTRRSSGRAYGGYQSGSRARSSSSRGARSRGGGGGARRGGGGRRR
jgi:hypothetical protein